MNKNTQICKCTITTPFKKQESNKDVYYCDEKKENYKKRNCHT